MKIRIFKNMCNSVFRIVVNTEDFSQEEIKLMCQYGEPEINVGGDIDYRFDGQDKTKACGDQLVRILHGFPYAEGFDSRDYEGSFEEAEAVGEAWKAIVIAEIRSKMSDLRDKASILPTEEVENI